jgi:hypothetical protein
MIAIINSVDVTSYLITFVKDGSACALGTSGTFRLTPNYPNTILPGCKAYFELGALKYSGWVMTVSVQKKEQPIIVTCSDMSPLLDYFFDDEYLIEEDTDVAVVAYNLLTLVGMNSTIPEEIGYDVKAGSNFAGYSGQAIMQHLLSQSGERYLKSDDNWKALYLPLTLGTPKTLTYPTELGTYKSSDWIRNQMVVVGMSPTGNRLYAKKTRVNSVLDPNNHIQRGIIINPQYDTQDKVDEIAYKALDFYSRLLYVKSITSVGDQIVSLGDTVSTNGYLGIVTNLKQSVYGRETYQEMELDNRCQVVWGWTGRTPRTKTFEITRNVDNDYSETVG